MEIVDCNNHIKTAINFFGPSCAVNSLINRYNPIGDNSDKYVLFLLTVFESAGHILSI